MRFVFGDGANRQTSHTQYGGDETCQLWDHTLELNAAARTTEIALATENRVWVIRADSAGKHRYLVLTEAQRARTLECMVGLASQPTK